MSELDQYESDTRDQCESFALLDDAVVREMDVCVLCNRHDCRHRCDFHGVSRPCPCDTDAVFFDSLLVRGRAGGKSR